jgi:hypothetical protein
MHDKVNEDLKTIGTVAVSILLLAAALGIAAYHILGQ